jgi:hypothetical protein
MEWEGLVWEARGYSETVAGKSPGLVGDFLFGVPSPFPLLRYGS